ncbi:hypothetical protein ACFQZ4_15340 [Catellatospora coxensis]
MTAPSVPPPRVDGATGAPATGPATARAARAMLRSLPGGPPIHTGQTDTCRSRGSASAGHCCSARSSAC